MQRPCGKAVAERLMMMGQAAKSQSARAGDGEVYLARVPLLRRSPSVLEP
jgi:hypothetical protein